MNKVMLMGRLTADPELRQTASGVSSCQFTVAVNRKYKNDKGGYDTDFIRCQAWRQTAEFVSRYFSKGRMIAVEGSLRTGSYTDKNHPDVTHYTTDVFVDNVEFCGSKSDSVQKIDPVRDEPSEEAMSYGSLSEFEEIISGDDVPF